MPQLLQPLVAALAVLPLAMGHTWIEQLRNVNSDGTYVGEYGYPRGMVAKTDPGFTGFSMNIELPAYQNKAYIDETTPLCHPAQRKQVQTQNKYPRLKTAPGGFVAMRYAENGHVTKPFNQKGKPAKGGTVFVYGTTTPVEEEKLVNVLQWSANGKGGNGKGALLAMNNFDDGRCYEVNETPVSGQRRTSDPNFAMGQVQKGPGNYPLMCETNVQLPKTADTGKPYTFYWVWQWNTAPGIDPGLPDGKDEYYTTCMDVDVETAKAATAAASSSKNKFALGPQQDAMSVAVANFASRTALMTNAIKGEVGPFFSEPTSGPNVSSQKPGSPVSTKRPGPSGAPQASAGIPTISKRPGAKPTTRPGEDEVTVTDTVVVTVTAPAGRPTTLATVTSKRPQGPPAAETPANRKPTLAVSTVVASRGLPAVATPPAAAPPAAGASGLSGFNMRNKNGAKFRRALM